VHKSEKRLKEIEEAIETDACLEKELQAVGAEFNYQMKQSLNDIIAIWQENESDVIMNKQYAS